MKNILFPTDFSEAANRAFIFALHLADRWQARITTLHVYQRPKVKSMTLPRTMEEFYATFDLYEFANYRDAIPPLVEIAEKNGFGSIPMQHVLEQGETKAKIAEIARRDKADLIVMGTTGAHGLKGVFIGSVAAKMLTTAPCPVLAVPLENTFDGKIDKIAFSISYRQDEKLGLEKLRNLFLPFHPEIHCLNVDLPHTYNLHNPMEKWKEGISTDDQMLFQILDGTDIYKAMTAYLTENNIDLIAMVTHQRKWIEELFTYSHAKKMSYHTKVPVLGIPEAILMPGA